MYGGEYTRLSNTCGPALFRNGRQSSSSASGSSAWWVGGWYVVARGWAGVTVRVVWGECYGGTGGGDEWYG